MQSSGWAGGVRKKKKCFILIKSIFFFFFFLGEKYHGNSLKGFNYKAGKRKEIY